MSKVIIRGRNGRAFFGVSILAMAVAAQSASAQSCPGVDDSLCEITVSGADQDVSTDGATHIVNSGTGTSITQTSNDYLLIENEAGASIEALTLLPQTTPPVNGLIDTTIINRGAINGSLVFANGGVYVNDGGTVADDLTVAHVNAIQGDANFQASFKTETFINRSAIGTTGVAGTIDPGNGLDFFIQSFSSTGTYALPATLPTHFEVGGVEALGTNTVVTVTSEPGEAHNGLSLYGDGNIVNDAVINDISFDGTGLSAQTINFLDLRLPAVVYGGEVGNNHLLLVPTAGSPAPVNYGGALTSFTNEGTINGDLRLRTVTFTNNDEINLSSRQAGTLIFGAADQDFTFTNRGTIEMVDTGTRAPDALTSTAVQLVSAIDATVLSAVNISNSGEIGGGLGFTGVALDFVFENSGTISMAGNPNGIDRAVELEIGGLEVALNPAFQEDAAANSVTVTNSATGTLDGGIDVFANTRAFAFTNDGIINQDADDAQAEAVQIDVDDYANAIGEEDVIDAESASFVNTGAITGTVELDMEATALTINNSGTISRGLTPGQTTFAEGFSGLEVEQETALGATLDFTNSGTIETADYAGGAVSLSVEAGDIGSGVAGAESANGSIVATNSGEILATGGHYVTPGQLLGLPQNQLLIDFAVGLTAFVDAEGTGSVSIVNEVDGLISARGFAHLGLPTGAQLIADQTAPLSGVAVAAGADTVTLVNHGTILGSVGGSLTLDNGVTLVPMADADVDFEGVIGGAIDTFGSSDDITNSATGVIEGGIALRQGDDTLRNYGSITGDIRFGTGNDTFIQGINATFTGKAFGGDGEDRFQLDITGGTLNNAVYDQFVSQLDSFEILGVTGSGNIDLSSSEENNSLVVDGTVNGNVDLGGGDNSLTLGGTVNGDIIFGSGNDALVLQPGAALTGTATGGDGFDSLTAPLTGTYEEPTVLDLAQFESFEELNVTSGGVGTVEGDLAFETVNVDDGRLIGLTGSTITGDVNVADGGTFGSAGTVNGDVDVEGTLSPGSSPGTMTVNGNVTLVSGSTTLFELTPTVSDAIVINGSLTIQSGTTLDITGERPLTPGVTYNLITTTDGITGSFTTINKADTVLGFISQTSTALQLLGTFQLRGGANAQVTATNTYLNSLLIGGQATAGILAAVPDLVGSDGFASEAALATIHPEAYASASQIGVENGLAISSALRSGNWAGRGGKTGLFTFAQGFGSWRNFKAESGSGASKANVRSSGFFGGVGYGNKNVSVSAFIGRVDANQSINAIGARNEADGTFFGATAELAFAGFRLGGSVVRDHSSADTSRALFDGSEATSHYRLRGTTADIHAGYGFAIAGGWEVGPEIGVTHVSVKRGNASETGAGAFNLTVAQDRISYTFLTADFALQRNEGALQPWLSAGVRQRLDNDRAQATASLAGVSTSFTVSGVQRDRSFGNIGAGVAWRQESSNLTLFARGNSEFGSDNNAQRVDAGLRLQF
ncbi:MAG TPA: autotransporter domain-containing protein [Rhizorhapis sp.]|nr:autotransporter domain-containing protein [Rhizorhapis sp.]